MTGPFDELTLALGAIFIALGLLARHRTKRFITRCLTTEGTVVGYKKEESSEGADFYYSTIRFVDASGTSHEIGGPHGSQVPPVIGTVHSITYDPSYPTNAWITGGCGPWAIAWLILLIGIGGVIAGFVMRVVE